MFKKDERLKVSCTDLTALKSDSALIVGLELDECTAKLVRELSEETSNDVAWALADAVVTKTISKDYCLDLQPFRSVRVEDMALMPIVNKVLARFGSLTLSTNLLKFVDLTGFADGNKSVFVRVSNWRVSLMVYSPK